MWQRVRNVAVTAALLALPLSIASPQTGSTPAAVGEPAGARPSGVHPATGNSAGNSGVQGAAGSTSGGDSLMPCPTPPPYTSRPCLPAKH
jgi:hypothetical protein